MRSGSTASTPPPSTRSCVGIWTLGWRSSVVGGEVRRSGTRDSCSSTDSLDVAVTWVTPFRVFEDERKTVLYYLVHLTNHDLGMREMKEAMVAKSGDMTFCP
jgi:hypothetical protein